MCLLSSFSLHISRCTKSFSIFCKSNTSLKCQVSFLAQMIMKTKENQDEKTDSFGKKIDIDQLM